MRANVARVRKPQGLTLRDVADRLTAIGRPMAHNTVSEIERGASRVDVDDLMALALALDVSPATLLMPESMTLDEPVEATGVPDDLTGEQLWSWLVANRPLHIPAGDLAGKDANDLLTWWARSRPRWSITFHGGTPDVRVEVGLTADGVVGRGND